MMDLDAVVAWEEVEERAVPMFDLHHRERGLAWARQAWEYLEADEMTRRYDSFAEGLTYLRLIALALVFDEYSQVAWNIHKGRSPLEWAADFSFSPFALGKMCGLDPVPINGDTDEEMCASTIHHCAQVHRWEVCVALVRAYGSVDGLHASLWHIRHDPQDLRTPDAFSDGASQKRAQAYLEKLMIPKEKEE